MSILSTIQIISRFEPPKTINFYVDFTTGGVIQLNFGYGLNITANGQAATDLIKNALTDANVSTNAVNQIVDLLDKYNDGQTTLSKTNTRIVGQLNHILVNAKVPVASVGAAVRDAFVDTILGIQLDADLQHYGLTQNDLPTPVLVALQDLRYNAGIQIYNPKTGTGDMPGLAAALKSNNWAAAAFAIEADPLARKALANKLAGLAYRRDTEAATMLGFEVKWNSNNTIQSLTPAAVDTATLIAYKTMVALRNPSIADPNNETIRTDTSNCLIGLGYYVIQPGDSDTTIAAMVQDASGISLDAATLRRINGAFTDSNGFGPGGLLHVPVAAVQIGPTPYPLGSLRDDQAFVYDSPTGTLYTVGAGPGSPLAGRLIIDGTPYPTPAGQIDSISVVGGQLMIDSGTGMSSVDPSDPVSVGQATSFYVHGHIDGGAKWIGLSTPLVDMGTFLPFTLTARGNLTIHPTSETGDNIHWWNTQIILLDSQNRYVYGVSGGFGILRDGVPAGTYKAGLADQLDGNGFTLGDFTLQIDYAPNNAVPFNGWSQDVFEKLLAYLQAVDPVGLAAAVAAYQAGGGLPDLVTGLAALATAGEGAALSRIGGVLGGNIIGSTYPDIAMAIYAAVGTIDSAVLAVLNNGASAQLRNLLWDASDISVAPVAPVSVTGAQSQFSLPVAQSVIVPLDPQISYAIRYDSGSGPLFSSVVAPYLGAGGTDYTLYVPQGDEWERYGHAQALQEFTFAAPQASFILAGIDVAAFPASTELVTGVSFANTGTFDGTLTALTADELAAIACFAAGTRIRTNSGEVAVEKLQPGAMLPTAFNGKSQPVVWIGRRRIDARRHPRPADVWPVRVRADAFSHDQPSRDLLLSPDHSVLLWNKLIPVRYLINGATLVQEPADAVTYFHVELPEHSAIFADGLAVESYLDLGNRSNFDNGGNALTLHPDFSRDTWDEKACGELVLGGDYLAAARRRLLTQARLLGYRLTHDPDLRLDVDGRTFRPEAVGGGWRFRFRAGGRSVRLRSCTHVPAHTDPGSDDSRILGVAVQAMLLDRVPVQRTDPRLADGWHAPEQGVRWTDGGGQIILNGERELIVHTARAGRYWIGPEQASGSAKTKDGWRCRRATFAAL